MPTVRKSSSPARALRTAPARRVESAARKKQPRPARPATRAAARPRSAAAGPRPVRPASARPSQPASKKKVLVVKKKPAVPVKSAAKKAASASKKPTTAAAPPASKKVRLKAVPRPPVPGPEVRPLGVLPPEARARGIERTAPGSANASRVAIARALRNNKSLGVQRVTEKDLKDLEQRLLSERARLMKEMGHLENTVLKVNPRDSAGDLSGYSFHMADAGTDAYEREKAFQFASTEGRLLMDLNEALRRLYRGEYGICESCGNPIAKARLEAMPTARLCRDCKEKEERESRRES